MRAYLGTIAASYPAEQSARVSKLGHLDLSHVKMAAPKEDRAIEPIAQATDSRTTATTQAEPTRADTIREIAVPVSLSAVVTVQKRIQDSLGVRLPLSTFVARATELANDDLPRPEGTVPSADELFDQILGLDKISMSGVSLSTTSRGHYTPQITALPSSPPPAPVSGVGGVGEMDVYDVLSSPASAKARLVSARSPIMKAAATDGARKPSNTFQVSVSSRHDADEQRARVFLDRLKLLLEAEPGRLVL